MKIDVLESNENVLRFSLKDVSVGVANAIRRAAINSVKTFAIDRVTFYENTTAIFDEYIAHRIGLVPIKTPTKWYSDTDEILFTLDATGPKVIYSNEIESSDKDIKVANDAIPIMKLAEGQRLRLDCKAIVSTASKHSKFQPGLVTYDQDKGTYNFYIESFGQMPPKEIINKAFEAIKEELKEIQKEAKKEL
jgi:DNA-directed RNA polymerase subunit D